MIHWVLNPFQTGNRPGAKRVRAVLLSLSLGAFFLLQGCIPMGSAGGSPEPAGPPIPAIRDGDLSRSETRRGRELLRGARDSLAAGSSYGWVLEAAQAVIQDYPVMSGSGEAFGLLARAHFQLGSLAGAADAARAYADLLGPDHPFFPAAVSLQASALNQAGDGRGALRAFLTLPAESPDSILQDGKVLVRELVPLLPARDLGLLTEGLPVSSPFRGIMATEWAVSLYLRGEAQEALRWAQAALASSLDEREGKLARGVADGRLEEVLGRPLILGVVLPRSGVSPNLLQYGEWVYEGIQVALEEFQPRLPRPIQLEIVDDRGTPLGGRTAIRSLDSFGAMGALGFLAQDVLRAAAATRQGDFPIISPFSFLPPEEAQGIYSLSGPDPGGARELARAAWELELETVAIVRPATEEARMDALAFREEFEALGGIVPRDIVFDSGGTFFQPQFKEVEALLPDGLFLPLTPRDIQLLAPQVTFYGVDTLGAQLLGTSDWTEDAVVMDVDSRHTDGVIAATTRLTQDDTESFLRFREAYESFFHKTLRSQVPAFGYDAAALIFKALEAGPRNPQELMAAMEEIRDFPGATGMISIEGGRITRDPLLVRIQDHELIYITRRFN